jgi:SRSO17 transposase
MSQMLSYTLEIYKSDKRVKEGKRLIKVEEFAPVTRAYIKAVIESKTKLGFIVEPHETYVTKRNMMTGKTYQERYDTPYFCSPSSESFWSN